MNLKDFTLMKEDDDSYTVGHPKGKSMSVPKKGLSEKAQKLISQLRREQKLADGGDVPNPTPTQSPEEAPAPEITAGQEQAAVGQEPSAPAAPAPAASVEAEAQAPSPQNQPAPIQMALNKEAPLEQEQKDIQGALGEIQKAGKAEAAAYGEQAAQLAARQKTTDQHYQDFQAKDQMLQQAVMNGKIDPNRWLNNMNTGSRIASSIGLALSGLGSGLTGQPNMAMQNINQAIERDMESQKSDLSKNMNLWKMNKDALGDSLQADLAFKSQLLASTQAKVQQAASGAMGAQAKMNAAPLLAQLNQQQSLNNWMRSRLSGAPSGTEAQHIAEMEVMEQVNPEVGKRMRNQYIGGVGTTQTPPSEKQREELISYQNFDKSFDRAEDFIRQHPHGVLPGTADAAEANSIKTGLDISMGHLAGLNRMSDTDLHEFQKMTPDVGSFFSSRALARLGTLRGTLNNQKQSLYHQLVVTPFKIAPEEERKMAWLQEQSKLPPESRSPRYADISQTVGAPQPAMAVAKGP